jgi:hypothetical protein
MTRLKDFSLRAVGVCAHSHSAPSPMTHIVIPRILLWRLLSFHACKDAQPCSAQSHSPMALNDIILALAHIIVVQIKKNLYPFFPYQKGPKNHFTLPSLQRRLPTQFVTPCYRSRIQKSIIKDSDPKHWPTSLRFKKTAVIIPGNKLVETNPL